MTTREKLIEEKITMQETISDQARQIDELKTRDIKNLLAAERGATAKYRETAELLDQCRARKAILANKLADAWLLLEAVQFEADTFKDFASHAQQALEKIASMTRNPAGDPK